MLMPSNYKTNFSLDGPVILMVVTTIGIELCHGKAQTVIRIEML